MFMRSRVRRINTPCITCPCPDVFIIDFLHHIASWIEKFPDCPLLDVLYKTFGMDCYEYILSTHGQAPEVKIPAV